MTVVFCDLRASTARFSRLRSIFGKRWPAPNAVPVNMSAHANDRAAAVMRAPHVVVEWVFPCWGTARDPHTALHLVPCRPLSRFMTHYGRAKARPTGQFDISTVFAATCELAFRRVWMQRCARREHARRRFPRLICPELVEAMALPAMTFDNGPGARQKN